MLEFKIPESKEDKLTNETIKNGYLHTGDKGVIDKDGYLTITGRIKDIFYKKQKQKNCLI